MVPTVAKDVAAVVKQLEEKKHKLGLLFCGCCGCVGGCMVLKWVKRDGSVMSVVGNTGGMADGTVVVAGLQDP